VAAAAFALPAGRVQPWSAVSLADEDLDPGDALIDWRYALPGQPKKIGWKYVHIFTPDELAELAARAGFEVRTTFESDGEGAARAVSGVGEGIREIPNVKTTRLSIKINTRCIAGAFESWACYFYPSGIGIKIELTK